MAKRILVVDDSQSMRQVQKLVLAGAGYEVLEACDGRDALAKLGSNAVNMILTDLNMPNLDGMGLIRGVRGHPVHRMTPIVMVTTESAENRMKEGKAAGATGWMVKPFTPEQLLAVVKRVLGKERP
jgi:two-component system, chemotaxis family, chemotaxis protein CheY